jgi:restriction endonuclease Mrr
MVRQASDWNKGSVNDFAAPLQNLLGPLDGSNLGALMAAVFEQHGYIVEGDRGFDLIIQQDGEQKAVQCQPCDGNTVGEKEIWGFLGALTDSGIENGILVSLQDFTDAARTLAEQHCIRLIDGLELSLMLQELNWKSNSAIQSALKGQRGEHRQRKAA